MVPILPARALTRRIARAARGGVFLASALLPALCLGPLIGWLIGGHGGALRWALAFGAAALLVVPLAGALALARIPRGRPWRAWIFATGGLAAPYWWLTHSPPPRPPRRSRGAALPILGELPEAPEWLAPTVLVFRGRRAPPPSVDLRDPRDDS